MVQASLKQRALLSDHHQAKSKQFFKAQKLTVTKMKFALKIFTTCSNIQVMQIKEVMTTIRCLDIRQILLTGSIRNVWRTKREYALHLLGEKSQSETKSI